ncbi:MAG: hypothetical protein HGB08_03355 [Candidatus Moranbacteria bacterium]|nr:hypothetical protein [Candidatus Moranbacteria bacterium]
MVKKLRIFFLALGTIVIVLALAAGGWYKLVYMKSVIAPDAAKTRVADFITKNLVKPGTKVEVASITKEFWMYKVDLKIGDQDVASYMTLDGKVFFPDEGMNIDDISKTASDTQSSGNSSTKSADIPKSDMPEVDLFVMSYCPYGTQIEKGILPVLETLGSNIKFNLKFVDYAMHGKKELDENLKQYCIEKNEPSKLVTYLGCFLKDSNSGDACVKSSNIDATKLASCVASTDEQFKVTADSNDKSTWGNGSYPPFNINKDDNTEYGVQGSPTLVINGTTVESAGRDPKSLLDTICSAFNNKPAECDKALSADSPAPGFGEATASGTDAAAGAACGS